MELSWNSTLQRLVDVTHTLRCDIGLPCLTQGTTALNLTEAASGELTAGSNPQGTDSDFGVVYPPLPRDLPLSECRVGNADFSDKNGQNVRWLQVVPSIKGSTSGATHFACIALIEGANPLGD